MINSRIRSFLLAGAMATGLAALPAPAAAQSAEDRIQRLEAQIRALQREVFPGGDERFFEPQVDTSRPTQPTQVPGTPSEGVLTDVLQRIEAIESQLARLTAASEVNANALANIEARLDEADAVREAELAAAAPSPAPAPAPSQQPSGRIDVPSDNGVPAPPAAGPTPARVAAVSEIAKPATDDPGDDEYTYGFRLWDAGFYPEAQQQLAMFVERYPNHPRTSYGRNLLGRAYLDAGDPRRAATYFFENYQADKQAARAPDSLLYLAETMIALGDTNRACIALAEFGDTYPALATGRLQSQYDSNRGRVDCN